MFNERCLIGLGLLCFIQCSHSVQQWVSKYIYDFVIWRGLEYILLDFIDKWI